MLVVLVSGSLPTSYSRLHSIPAHECTARQAGRWTLNNTYRETVFIFTMPHYLPTCPHGALRAHASQVLGDAETALGYVEIYTRTEQRLRKAARPEATIAVVPTRSWDHDDCQATNSARLGATLPRYSSTPLELPPPSQTNQNRSLPVAGSD